MKARVQLIDRGEVVRYEGASGVHTFDVWRQGKTWVVRLDRPLSQKLRAEVFPHIEAYLSLRKLFGIWPVHYKVKFHEDHAA